MIEKKLLGKLFFLNEICHAKKKITNLKDDFSLTLNKKNVIDKLW